MAKAKADVLAIDTAHGHTERAHWKPSKPFATACPDMHLVAGNVATYRRRERSDLPRRGRPGNRHRSQAPSAPRASSPAPACHGSPPCSKPAKARKEAPASPSSPMAASKHPATSPRPSPPGPPAVTIGSLFAGTEEARRAKRFLTRAAPSSPIAAWVPPEPWKPAPRIVIPRKARNAASPSPKASKGVSHTKAPSTVSPINSSAASKVAWATLARTLRTRATQQVRPHHRRRPPRIPRPRRSHHQRSPQLPHGVTLLSP